MSLFLKVHYSSHVQSSQDEYSHNIGYCLGEESLKDKQLQATCKYCESPFVLIKILLHDANKIFSTEAVKDQLQSANKLLDMANTKFFLAMNRWLASAERKRKLLKL